MSINIYQPFEAQNKTYPFKIRLTLFEEKNYISVESLSVLFDTYSNAIVDIKNIGENIEITTSKTNIYLTFDISNNVTASNGEIIISTLDLTERIESGTLNDGQDSYKITKINKLLGSISAGTPQKRDNSYITQNINYNLRSIIDCYSDFNLEPMFL